MNKTFLTWPGIKTKLLPNILPYIGTPRMYVEPFAGSMVVAMNVSSHNYIINDINKDLISLYWHLLNDIDGSFQNECRVIISQINNTKEKYNIYRDIFNNSTDSHLRAKTFFYINKTCFNGIIRYNKDGKFNVPFGDHKKIEYPEKEVDNFLRFFENRKITLFSGDFSNPELYSSLGKNDVVYFDPPYLPINKSTNIHTHYYFSNFGMDEHTRIMTLIDILIKKKVKVIISNHDSTETRKLYKGADIFSFSVYRPISGTIKNRKKVKEILAIYNNDRKTVFDYV